jgi:Peptidase family C25/CARDB
LGNGLFLRERGRCSLPSLVLFPFMDRDIISRGDGIYPRMNDQLKTPLKTNRTRSFPSLFCFGLLLSVLFLSTAHSEPRILFQAPSASSLLCNYQQLTVATDGLTVSREISLRTGDQDLFLAAVPPGPLDLKIQAISVRDFNSGQLIMDLDEETHTRLLVQLEKRCSVVDFGSFRGLKTARVQVKLKRPFLLNSKNCEVASYTLKLSWPEYTADPCLTNDSAFAPGAPFRTILETLLICPEMIDTFRQELTTPFFPGPTQWQPTAEDSPNFPWFKIYIKEQGLYSIDGRWFENAGIDSTNLSPTDLYLVRNGEQVPTEIMGPMGKGFKAGERLVFYALGNDSKETAEQVYFLGKRPLNVPEKPFVKGPPDSKIYPEFTQFTSPASIKEENHFDTEFGTFLSVQKMSWYWGKISNEELLKTKFNLPGLSNTDKDKSTTISLTLHFKGKTRIAATNLQVYHHKKIITEFILKPGQFQYDFALSNNKLSQNGNLLGFKLKFPTGRTQHTPVFLDSITLNYNRFFTSDKGTLDIQFPDQGPAFYGKSRLRCTGFRASNTIALDLSDPTAPERLSISAEQRLMWVRADLTPTSHLLIAEERSFNTTPHPQPSHWNPDLLSPSNSADILILYHPLFTEAAQELHQHYLNQDIQPFLVDINSVYEGFNYGNLSTEAIRNFLAYALYHWRGERNPQAALLIGDSNSDGRGEAKNGVPNYMPIHLYQRSGSNDFSCDSYYSWLDQNDEATDLLIGRLSSELPQDALAWVGNVKKYSQYSKNKNHSWKNQILAIADTGNFYPKLRTTLDKTIFNNQHLEILAADNFLWEDNYYLPPHLINRVEDSKVCPMLTSAIEDAYNQGSAISLFIGHGAPNLWSNQRYWFGGGTPNSDILRLKNKDRLPFVTSFTCNNAVVDYPIKPWNICLAEDFMRHPDKGAIACFMPTGPGFLPQHQIMIEGLTKSFQSYNIRNMSVLSELARIYQKAHTPNDNHSRMFLYLGDPFLSLPEFKQPQPTLDALSSGQTLINVINPDKSIDNPMISHWDLILENPTIIPQKETLLARLYNENGDSLGVEKIEFTVAAKQFFAQPVQFLLPGFGPYMIDFELESESAQLLKSSLPSRKQTRYFHAGEGSSISIYKPSIDIISRNNNKGKITLTAQLINTSTTQHHGKLTVILPDGAEVSSNDILLNPSASQQAYIDLSYKTELLKEIPLTVNLYSQQQENGAMELVESHPYTISPPDHSDLSFVTAPPEITPESPSEGLTILINVVVFNNGNKVSFPSNIGLFKENTTDFRTPLRNIPGKPLLKIPSLYPGEKKNMQLRWDPIDNAGFYDILVKIDPENLNPESNKENNLMQIPLNVRSKMKLATNGITVEQGKSPGTVQLVASVRNDGETDAPRVAVYFYRTKEQTQENFIGETLIDRIPALSEEKVIYTWSLIGEKNNLDILDPSFTVALKGSLMRSSSVADQ